MTVHEEVAKAILEGGDWWEEFQVQASYSCTTSWHPSMGPRDVFRALADDRLRKKPRTIKINEFVIPAPVREPLEPGTRFWIANILGIVKCFTWHGHQMDYQWLKAGIIHLSKENAQAHHDVLVKVNNA